MSQGLQPSRGTRPPRPGCPMIPSTQSLCFLSWRQWKLISHQLEEPAGPVWLGDESGNAAITSVQRTRTQGVAATHLLIQENNHDARVSWVSFCLIRSTCPCPCPQVNLPVAVCDDVVAGAVGGGGAGAVGGGGGGEDDAGRGELRGGGGAPPGQARLQGGGQGGEQEQVEQEEVHAGE